MAGMSVDHLRLHVSELSREEAERLAQLVAGRLRAAGPGHVPGGRIGTLQVKASGEPGASVDRLAEQIAGQVLAALSRWS